jgi:hypothetical protein
MGHTGKLRTDELRESLNEEWAAPLFGVFGVILAGAACIFLLLYYLSRPAVNPNPGLAAFKPPPATRLVPLPRKSDAPELAELPAEPPSPLTALAQAQPSEQPAKREARSPARKRPHVEPREDDRARFGPDQQWKFGYRDWNNSRDWNNNRDWNWNNNRKWAGNSRPWF